MALIMVPSRELALQIESVLKQIQPGCKITACYGGHKREIEENNLIEVVVAEDQLSLAIGRGGQNVKLASKLVGFKIDVMTDDQESARRTAEFNQASKLFIEALDVEDMIANLLASEGFLSVEDLASAEISEIQSIEGFDEDLAKEIKKRAEEYLQKIS